MKKPEHLMVEHYAGDVIGIGEREPRLTWNYTEQIPDGATVQLSVRRKILGGMSVCGTYEVPADQNILCGWPDKPLNSREQVFVKVRLCTKTEVSDWSEELFFETGLLDKFEMRAYFIGPSWYEGRTDKRPVSLIRTEFDLGQNPVWARLYISALGLVEPEINGGKVSEDILIPGWTNYENRVLYWSYDITAQLQKGKNAAGFWLGDGWYRGRIGFNGGKANVYGEKNGILAQIEVGFEDGTVQRIVSNSWDGKWKASVSPILSSDLAEGEVYDRRLEKTGWSAPFYDDSDWSCVAQIPYDMNRVMTSAMSPVRKAEERGPVNVEKIGEQGERTDWIIDFGQNCTQRLKIFFQGFEHGDRIRIQHAEVLEKDGTLCTRPLRRGQQIDEYISNGEDAWWEPRFSIHGFRYVQITGWRGELFPQNVISCVYYSDLRRKGSLETSNAMVNRLYANVLWSMRSNFVSVPTDCPQRDERLGWTGDIALFSPTANFLYDVHSFLSNWMEDVAFEQKKWGTVPFYVPYLPLSEWSVPQAIAIWGDAAVLVPWYLYLYSGDRNILKKQYQTAQCWVDEVIGYLSKNGVWDRKPDYVLGQLGDWLDPTAPPDDATKAMTEKELVATAFFAKSVELLARMSKELNYLEKESYYREKLDWIRKGFLDTFVRDDGFMTSDTQCAYALAIEFGLLDEYPQLKKQAGERLAQLVRESEGKVGTGFAGTPYVLPALTQTDHVEEAYDLFFSEKCPSWMYQVRMGGTTTWERWDSMLEDGTVNPGDMTSFNHYALGSVADWMHGVIGGIKPLEPGWKTFQIAPRQCPKISHACVTHETPNGRIEVNWRVCEETSTFQLDITVPYGITGILDVLGQEKKKLGGGTYHFQFH